MQLTDEPEKRCYPLGDHLYCRSCHIRQGEKLGYTSSESVRCEMSILVTIMYLLNRVLSRFFDQVGHETTYASTGNKHFFTKFH
jgi:hypothetical protein